MSEIKVDTLTGKTTANDITVTVGATATQSLEQGLAKVWLDQNHRTSFGTNDSFNVSGVTDTSGGVLDVSFTNNMSASNYASPTSGISEYANTNSSGGHYTVATDTSNRTSSALKTISSDYNNASRADSERVDLAVFGDLA